MELGKIPDGTQVLCFSGSYTRHEIENIKKEEPKDKGVREFFEFLGYTVGWDRRGRECWFELYDDGGLVAQIDQGVPLDDIIMDMIEFHHGREGISKSNYTVSGDGQPIKDLFERVYNWKVHNADQHGQLWLKL